MAFCWINRRLESKFTPKTQKTPAHGRGRTTLRLQNLPLALPVLQAYLRDNVSFVDRKAGQIAIRAIRLP